MKSNYRLICILLSFFILSISLAQTPFKINPTTGLHLLDANNNPILNDKNYIITPVADYEFTDESSTRNDWMYDWTTGHYNSSERNEHDGFFYVTGDANKDNMNANPSTCTQFSPTTYSNNNFSYTYNREFNTSGGINTVTLKTRREATPIKAYYTKYDCNSNVTGITKYPKSYDYSTAVLVSKNAYKYGYFEARFKVSGLPNNQSKGVGHAFWLSPNWKYSTTWPANISNGSRISYYSEIDIAECDARRGLMTGNVIYNFSNYGI